MEEPFSRQTVDRGPTKTISAAVRPPLQVVHKSAPGLAVGLIVLTSLVLRVYGNNLSLPYVPHPDEPAVVDRALAMLRTGDYDPHSFIYPTLYTYLQFLVYVAHFVWGSSQGLYKNLSDLPTSTAIFTTAPGFYLWGRFLTATLGAATVFIVYWTGARLYTRSAGLIGALLLTFSVLHVEHSHYITVDVPAAFFSALAFAFIAGLYIQGKKRDGRDLRRNYLLAGLFVGLAVGTKYNAVVIIVPLILAHLFTASRRSWLSGNFLTGLALVAVGFLASSPFALPDLPRFLDDLASIIYHYKFVGHPGYEGTNNWLYYLNYFWSSETGPSLLVAGGVALCFFRHHRRDILLLLFPLLYLAGLSPYKVNFLRNLLPMVPFLALLGGVFVSDALDWFSRRVRQRLFTEPLLAMAVAATLIVLPAMTIVDNDRYNSKDDSRVLAERWIRANLPRTGRVMAELNPVQWRDYQSVSTTESLIDHPWQWYLQQGFQYLVVNSSGYEGYLRDPSQHPVEVKAYEELFKRFPMVKQFAGKQSGEPGPEVTILKAGLVEDSVSIPYRSGASFGGAITLVGYDLGVEKSQARQQDRVAFKPGDAMHLVLFWKAERTLSKDYTVFIHLLGPDGRVVAQRDTSPISGSAPTSGWRQDDFVIDPAPLTLPQNADPGQYRLEVGLYDQKTMERLHVSLRGGKLDDKVLSQPFEVK